MPIDYDLVERIVKNHNEKRNEFIKSYPGEVTAPMLFDEMQPFTTNKKQLEIIGVDCSDINANLEEVIEALRLIGVDVKIWKGTTRSKICNTISTAISDSVKEAWRNENMREVLEVY